MSLLKDINFGSFFIYICQWSNNAETMVHIRSVKLRRVEPGQYLIEDNLGTPDTVRNLIQSEIGLVHRTKQCHLHKYVIEP